MLAQGPPLVFAAEEVAALQLGNARLRARGPLLFALLSGTSESGPSSSKTEASQPKAIDKEAIGRRGARGCRARRACCASSPGVADYDEAAGQDLDVVRAAPDLFAPAA